MKFRICENGVGKFKIQKRNWILCVPYWLDVTRFVSVRVPSQHWRHMTTFNTKEEAEKYIVYLRQKKKKKKVRPQDVWHCLGEY